MARFRTLFIGCVALLSNGRGRFEGAVGSAGFVKQVAGGRFWHPLAHSAQGFNDLSNSVTRKDQPEYRAAEHPSEAAGTDPHPAFLTLIAGKGHIDDVGFHKFASLDTVFSTADGAVGEKGGSRREDPAAASALEPVPRFGEDDELPVPAIRGGRRPW